MNKELAMRIAVNEDHKTLVEFMKRANEIFSANVQDGLKPFSDQEVAFAGFLDHVKATATQREKDLIVVTEGLCRAYSILHIGVQVMGEDPNEHEADCVVTVVDALERLGLPRLLMDGLEQRAILSIARMRDMISPPPSSGSTFVLASSTMKEEGR